MDRTVDAPGNAKGSKKNTYSNIAEFLEAHRGENHLVVLHDFPDPDAISSAFAHRLISNRYGIDTTIVYRGKISHQENIALIRLLAIEPTPFSDSLDLTQFDGAVFIDNQGTTCKEIVDALKEAGVPVLAVIDHHEKQELLEPEFSDIRHVGAVATIYAEYLEQGLVELNRSNRADVTVATALMHGLITDTQDFIRANEQDLCAAAFLSKFRDVDLLIQIMSQTRSKQMLEVIRLALGNRVVVENFSIAGIGYLRAEDRDAIPQAADFLLTEENVHTAIVYGIVRGPDGEEKLIGSLRTAKITLRPDEFIKEVFGKNVDGRYIGGGKELAGGFEIQIGFLAGDQNEEYNQIKWEVYDHQVKQKIFSKIGVSHNLDSGSSQTKTDDVGTQPHAKRAPNRS